MSSSNFQNSGNSLEAFRRAWKINGVNSPDGWLGGYVRVPNVFFRYMMELNLGGSQASLGILLIYLISRDYGNRKGHCYPGHSEIARHLGLSTTSVERNLKKLASMEMIEIERRMNDNGTFHSNIYTWEGFKNKLRQLLIRDKLIVGQNEIPTESPSDG